MAKTKTLSKNVTQQPILNTDVKSTAPEAIKKPVRKSRRKTSLDEFAIVNNIRPEVKAGFKSWLKGENFHFDSEWSELFKQYQNR